MTKLQKNSKPDLSIVIVNYNTRDITIQCLESIKKSKSHINYEIIVVDNNSVDGSVEALEKRDDIRLIKSQTNLGFSKGNNKARKFVKADTVLFLNSDTIVHANSLDLPFEYLYSNDDFGALTIKTVLPSGEYDPDMRRRFPTPSVSMLHFLGFSKTYRYEDVSPETVHEIDVAQGAYLMIKKDTLEKVDWFDEDYFLDGEDIDLCWKIIETGKKIIYFPDAEITHIKKASKNTDRQKSIASVTRGVEAMKIFYRKRLSKNYSSIENKLIFISIDILKGLRILKYKLTS